MLVVSVSVPILVLADLGVSETQGYLGSHWRGDDGVSTGRGWVIWTRKVYPRSVVTDPL